MTKKFLFVEAILGAFVFATLTTFGVVEWFGCLVWIVFAGAIAFEIKQGWTFALLSYTREDNPRAFWSIIAWQSVVLVALILVSIRPSLLSILAAQN